MRDRQIRKSAVSWIVGILAVVLLSTVLMAAVGGGAGDTSGITKLLWFFQGLDEHGLPAQSRYEMITYDTYTVDQDTFPIYYNHYTEENLKGTVTCLEGSSLRVRLDIGDKTIPGIDGSLAEAQGNGKWPDYFVGYRDSLQQLSDAGYEDFFVICYENGMIFMGGVKDGKAAVLPMWERMKGMEYVYSHFLQPMPLEEAEESMRLWRANVDEEYRRIGCPHLYFEDLPQENWFFAPYKGRCCDAGAKLL